MWTQEWPLPVQHGDPVLPGDDGKYSRYAMSAPGIKLHAAMALA